MAVISNLDINVRARIKGFEEKLKKAERSIESLQRTNDRLRGSMMSTTSVAAGMIKGFLGIAAIRFVVNAIRQATTFLIGLVNTQRAAIDETAKFSKRLGISTEAIEQFTLAGNRAGIDSETLRKSIAKMTNSIGEAALGTGEAGAALTALGLSAKSLMGLQPDEQLRKIVAGLEGVSNSTRKVQLAMDIFGRQGVTLLSLTSEELRNATKDAETFGLTFSAIDAAKVEQANDAMGDLHGILDGVGRQLAIMVSPVITEIAEKVKSWIREQGGVRAIVDSLVGGVEGLRAAYISVTEVLRVLWQVLSDIWSMMVAIAGVNAFGQQAEQASGLATVLGTIADVMHTVRLIALGINVGFAAIAQGIMYLVAKLMEGTTEILRTFYIISDETAARWTQMTVDMRNAYHKQTTDAAKAFGDAFIEKTPSERIAEALKNKTKIEVKLPEAPEFGDLPDAGTTSKDVPKTAALLANTQETLSAIMQARQDAMAKPEMVAQQQRADQLRALKNIEKNTAKQGDGVAVAAL